MEGASVTWPERRWEDRKVALEDSESQMEGVKATVTMMEVEDGEEKQKQWLQQEVERDRLVELMQAASPGCSLCWEQVQQLQQEVEELKAKCTALESARRERAQLSRRVSLAQSTCVLRGL